jgi:thymidylate synthase
MQNYLELLRKILEHGVDSSDRTGVGTRSLFAEQLRFDLKQGFPAVTTKKLAWRSMVAELLWFIEGTGDERRLAEIQHGTRNPEKTTIWTANANADYWKPKARYDGDLGRVYGVQWRNWRKVDGWKTVDQLRDLITGLKNNPNGRRHILSAWNPGELDEMALPPCHMMAQFYIRNNTLSCQMYQRSCDAFLGLPFNIASYALLTHLVAKTIGAEVGELIVTLGDVHIYNNHVDAVAIQLDRTPHALPTLAIAEHADIWNAKLDDCTLIDYQHDPAIQAAMAV